MTQRMLIAGIGNLFLGDDAFGVEVVRLLMGHKLPEDVRVVNFGIRGLDLVYSLLEGWESVIFIDAVSRGEAPGTLYVIEIDREEINAAEGSSLAIDGHQMDPVRVLRLAASMGAKLPQITIVGCEPSPLDGYDIHAGLTPAVAAALPRAVQILESVVHKFLTATRRQAVPAHQADVRRA